MKAQVNHPDLTTTSIVAKLLARENITVIKGNYQTASFDTNNRVLYLPLFDNKLSKDCADMFVGHEVGHALYTPAETIVKFRDKYPKIPFSLLNIVEDIRIERMIQETYPGLLTCFHKAYAELIAMDIFKIQGRDLQELNVADRLNLHAKIGNHLSIPLTDSELQFYKKCYAAQTIDEVIQLTVELNGMFEASKQEDSQSEQMQSADASHGDQEFESPSGAEEQLGEKSDSIGETEDEDSEDDTEQKQNSSSTSGTGAGNKDVNKSDVVSETENAISEFFKQNIEKKEFNILSAAPRSVSMATVIPYHKLRTYRDTYTQNQISLGNYSRDEITRYDADIAKLISVLEAEANVLVSEFNMRKSASNYQKTAQSRTGNIDTNSLHRYKTSDDIFKTLTIEPNQQNHGMVMFVDYSGSMQNNNAIVSVLRQTITLALFCRKLSIPFDVYGFTSGSVDPSERDNRIEKLFDTSVSNRVKLGYETKIFNLVSSSNSSVDFKSAIKNLAGDVVSNFNYIPCSNPTEHMGGTPLAETMIVAHDIVKDFRIKHKVENLNVVFLTDGDGGDLSASTSMSRHKNSYMMLHGRQVNFQSLNFRDVYSALAENLRITQGCKLTGYFVSSGSDYTLGRFLPSQDVPAILKTMRAEGYATVKAYNFDEYYVIKPIRDDYSNDNIAWNVSEESSIREIARSMISAGKNNRKAKCLLRSLAKTFAV